MPVKETHPRERGSRVTGDGMRLYRRLPRIARAREYTLLARTPGDTRESINDVGTLLVQLGEQLERGEGKSERESVRLRAFARASIKASAAGRSVHFSRAFETGNPADSKPVLVRDFENRVLSGRLIACIRKIIKKEKKETDRRELREFFFLSKRFARDGPLVFL